MLLSPEKLLYQPAENIELRPMAYVKAVAGDVLTLSNVDGFAAGQAIDAYVPVSGAPGILGGVVSVAAKVAPAVVKSAKTLELAVGDGADVPVGSTLVGPPLISLGGTNGGVAFNATEENVFPEYDQVEGVVDAIPVMWTVNATFNLMEFDLKQWGMLLQMGYVTRALAAGPPAVTAADILADSYVGARPQRYGAVFTFAHQDPLATAAKIRLFMFKVASINGLQTAFTKRDPSGLEVNFQALADPDRPRGRRFYQIVAEIPV